ncbi:MAG: hypothetical protein LBE80_07045 [Deltaproteobacteria bacterium]|jgi:hypothetical protein|nr:hypothetical protein [Deltaproteobacteria bacterium]
MENDKLIEAPRLLLVSASGVKAGKTTLSTALVWYFSKVYSVIGLKVTTAESGRPCQRHSTGCGACQFDGPFVLSQELDRDSPKDTSKLLASGAKKVFWLRACKDSLAQGFEAFNKLISKRYLVVAESNSLRQFVKPGLMYYINNPLDSVKASAKNLDKLCNVLVDLGHSLEDQKADLIARSALARSGGQDFFKQFKISPAGQKIRDKYKAQDFADYQSY